LQGKELPQLAKKIVADLQKKLEDICDKLTHEHMAQDQTEFDEPIKNLMPK
jgi:hypothetical protein